MSVLVAAGPCLMMAMAAIALFIVHSSVSRVRHALVWAAACAFGAVQWGVIAIRGLPGGPLPGTELIAELFGIGSMLLLVGGFRIRAGAPGMGPVPLVAGISATLILLVMALLPPMPLRAAVLPIVSIAMLARAAALIAPAGHPRSEAELAATVMLLALALIHLVGSGLAVAEQARLIASHHPYVTVYLATVEPAYAGLALFLLLLIAFDFAAELRRLVHADPLTGVLNRQGFDYAAAAIVRRARSHAFSIVIADIDRFTDVNDRRGHAAGDATLKAFATHLASGLRPDETVARIGGEEFALLLPATNGARALARTEDIRARLAGLAVEGHPEIAITASFGVAERAPDEPIDALFERADQALYQSKRQGRDRTTLAGRPGCAADGP